MFLREKSNNNIGRIISSINFSRLDQSQFYRIHLSTASLSLSLSLTNDYFILIIFVRPLLAYNPLSGHKYRGTLGTIFNG